MRKLFIIAALAAAGTASAADAPQRAAEVCREVPAGWVYFNCSRLYMICAANMKDGWYWREGSRECGPADR